MTLDVTVGAKPTVPAGGLWDTDDVDDTGNDADDDDTGFDDTGFDDTDTTLLDEGDDDASLGDDNIVEGNGGTDLDDDDDNTVDFDNDADNNDGKGLDSNGVDEDGDGLWDVDEGLLLDVDDGLLDGDGFSEGDDDDGVNDDDSVDDDDDDNATVVLFDGGFDVMDDGVVNGLDDCDDLAGGVSGGVGLTGGDDERAGGDEERGLLRLTGLAGEGVALGLLTGTTSGDFELAMRGGTFNTLAL